MISLDSGHWPLVLIQYRGVVSLSDLNGSISELDRVLDRRQPFVSIGDISELRMPGPDVMRRNASWYKDNDGALRSYCLGAATIATQATVRGILKAANFLHPLPQPHLVVQTFDEALEFVERKLAERKLTLPKSVQSLRHATKPG
jgi:hypothetical protein